MYGTNPVGVFLPTNYTSQTGTAYPLAIDGNWAVSARIIDNFAPHAQSTPNMTVALDAGWIWPGGTTAPTEVAAQSTGTVSSPASGYTRIDFIYVDGVSGAVGVVTGSPSTGTPSVPALPAGKLPVCTIGDTGSGATALSSATTAITNALLTDRRAVWVPYNMTYGNITIGSGGAITSSGPGGALGANAFNSTSYLPLAGGTMTGTLTGADGGTWSSAGISGLAGFSVKSGSATVVNAGQNSGGGWISINALASGGYGHLQGMRNGTVEYYLGLDSGNNFSLLDPSVTEQFGVGTGGGTGGLMAGSPTGGFLGTGKINVAGGYYVNGALAVGARFTSSAQSVPATTSLTVAHGLGATPFGYSVSLKNVNAEHGYTTGQEVDITSSNVVSGGTYGWSTSKDATNIIISSIGNLSSFLVVVPQGGGSSGSLTGITAANWSIIVRAWL